MDTTIKKDFLTLVRIGIDHSAVGLSNTVDWAKVQSLANDQGLSAIVLDGVERLREKGSLVVFPDKKVLTQWIGEILQGYECRYELYRRTIAEMARFYNCHGFKMMVLKGFACSLNWPKPEHRPTGDIDIWQFGKQKEADAMLASEKGIEIDKRHHHHTVFYWRDFIVENHFDFINVHHHKSHRGLEKVFKELGKDDTRYVIVYGEKVYLPSPNLHALFLVRHAFNHFVSIGINLRQVLDWAFFVEKHTKEIDWKWFSGMLDKYHMTEFCNCMNSICVDDLGFNPLCFNGLQSNHVIKDRVLSDILNPAFPIEEPQRLLPRVVYKIQRWKGNAWKQELCYNESRWSAFWRGVWIHLLKPYSI